MRIAPIRTRDELKAAVAAATDEKSFWYIERMAKALGALDEIPKHWTIEHEPDFREQTPEERALDDVAKVVEQYEAADADLDSAVALVSAVAARHVGACSIDFLSLYAQDMLNTHVEYGRLDAQDATALVAGVRKVATPAGVKKFGQPIGTIIKSKVEWTQTKNGHWEMIDGEYKAMVSKNGEAFGIIQPGKPGGGKNFFGKNLNPKTMSVEAAKQTILDKLDEFNADDAKKNQPIAHIPSAEPDSQLTDQEFELLMPDPGTKTESDGFTLASDKDVDPWTNQPYAKSSAPTSTETKKKVAAALADKNRTPAEQKHLDAILAVPVENEMVNGERVAWIIYQGHEIHWTGDGSWDITPEGDPDNVLVNGSEDDSVDAKHAAFYWLSKDLAENGNAFYSPEQEKSKNSDERHVDQILKAPEKPNPSGTAMSTTYLGYSIMWNSYGEWDIKNIKTDEFVADGDSSGPKGAKAAAAKWLSKELVNADAKKKSESKTEPKAASKPKAVEDVVSDDYIELYDHIKMWPLEPENSAGQVMASGKLNGTNYTMVLEKYAYALIDDDNDKILHSGDTLSLKDSHGSAIDWLAHIAQSKKPSKKSEPEPELEKKPSKKVTAADISYGNESSYGLIEKAYIQGVGEVDVVLSTQGPSKGKWGIYNEDGSVFAKSPNKTGPGSYGLKGLTKALIAYGNNEPYAPNHVQKSEATSDAPLSYISVVESIEKQGWDGDSDVEWLDYEDYTIAVVHEMKSGWKVTQNTTGKIISSGLYSKHGSNETKLNAIASLALHIAKDESDPETPKSTLTAQTNASDISVELNNNQWVPVEDEDGAHVKTLFGNYELSMNVNTGEWDVSKDGEIVESGAGSGYPDWAAQDAATKLIKADVAKLKKSSPEPTNQIFETVEPKTGTPATTATPAKFVANKQIKIGAIDHSAKKGDPHFHMIKHSMADGETPGIGMKVIDKNGNTGTVQQVFQAYTSVKWDNTGKNKTVSNKTLNKHVFNSLSTEQNPVFPMVTKPVYTDQEEAEFANMLNEDLEDAGFTSHPSVVLNKGPQSHLQDLLKIAKTNGTVNTAYGKLDADEVQAGIDYINKYASIYQGISVPTSPFSSTPTSTPSEPVEPKPVVQPPFTSKAQKKYFTAESAALQGKTTPVKSLGDGTQPTTGLEVVTKEGDSGKIVETYQTHSKVQFADGTKKSMANSKLNAKAQEDNSSTDLYAGFAPTPTVTNTGPVKPVLPVENEDEFDPADIYAAHAQVAKFQQIDSTSINNKKDIDPEKVTEWEDAEDYPVGSTKEWSEIQVGAKVDIEDTKGGNSDKGVVILSTGTGTNAAGQSIRIIRYKNAAGEEKEVSFKAIRKYASPIEPQENLRMITHTGPIQKMKQWLSLSSQAQTPEYKAQGKEVTKDKQNSKFPDIVKVSGWPRGSAAKLGAHYTPALFEKPPLSTWLKSQSKYTKLDFKNAVDSYTGSGYSSMNSYLRTGKTSGYGATDLKKRVEAMHEGMQHTRTQANMKVYRLANVDPELLVPGSIFEDKGFISTTINPGTSKFHGLAGGNAEQRTTFEMLIPAGTPAVYVPTFDVNAISSEGEVVLDYGNRFKVLYNNNGHVVVQLIPKPE